MIEVDKKDGKVGVKWEGTDSELMFEFSCLAAALIMNTDISKQMLMAAVQAAGSQRISVKMNHPSSIFVRRLSHLLEVKGINLKDFTKEMKISEEQMDIYMSGKSMPAIGDLQNMSKRLDVPFDYLIGGKK